MKAKLSTLSLKPGDIVVVTVPPPRPGAPINCQQIGQRVREQLGVPVRVVVLRQGFKIEGRSAQQLADLLSPEELYQATERINQRLLAEPGVGLPMQRAKEICGTTYQPSKKKTKK